MQLTLAGYAQQRLLRAPTAALSRIFALSAIISVNIQNAEITEKLYELGIQGVDDVDPAMRKSGTRVFVDGRLIGYIEKGEHLADTLRSMRRSGKIHPHVGIYLYSSQNPHATKRLYISCNAGRVLRSLVVIRDGRPLVTYEVIEKISKKFLSWNDLIYMGMIELVDANEEENCYVAIDPKKIEPTAHSSGDIPICHLGCGSFDHSISRAQPVTKKYLRKCDGKAEPWLFNAIDELQARTLGSTLCFILRHL